MLTEPNLLSTQAWEATSLATRGLHSTTFVDLMVRVPTCHYTQSHLHTLWLPNSECLCWCSCLSVCTLPSSLLPSSDQDNHQHQIKSSQNAITHQAIGYLKETGQQPPRKSGCKRVRTRQERLRQRGKKRKSRRCQRKPHKSSIGKDFPFNTRLSQDWDAGFLCNYIQC